MLLEIEEEAGLCLDDVLEQVCVCVCLREREREGVCVCCTHTV